MPLRSEPVPLDKDNKPTKWRLCQNFREINKATEIAPMPQGDIRAKQQRLSGHRYLHVFDFAAGFHAVSVHEDSQPYITFYVEGRGFFAYQRMPFGVTGGPSEFAVQTANSLHDIVADGTIELFVEDGGAGSDTFEEGLRKLVVLLDRVRKEGLSLAPSKLRLFMSEAVYAGALVSAEGVKPDPAKLIAVVDWPRPQDASGLEGFLGLTGYFRDLIKDYAKFERPLRNLLRLVPIPKNAGKSAHRRAMRAFKMDPVWREEHTKAFIALKTKLVEDPVVRAPLFDGTPFILTTDGSMDAFAAVLAQCMITTLPKGNVVTRTHPIAYASKQTSPAEEKYKPFLLEFAALKYALDKFGDIIWGSPIELHTDCQALRDVLLSDKLNATHARWRDGVLAYNITNVTHVPGTTNIADGLSRQYEGVPKADGDGSKWTVEPGWEQAAGLPRDVYMVAPTEEASRLVERFKDEPLYAQVVEALLNLPSDATVKQRASAKLSTGQHSTWLKRTSSGS